MEKLLQWIEANNLDVQINFPLLEVPNFGKLLYIQPKGELVFTEGYSLNLSDAEYNLAENIDYLLFQFGDKFYYTDKIEKPDLHLFKYVGNVKTIFPQPDLPFLGIHSGYDLCNGSRTYEDWCKKAKFLGITTLGIAETNTLAGAIAFQKACEKEGINGIVGETVRVEHGSDVYHIKLYPINREVGWRNLLLINAELNVHSENGSIKEEVLFQYSADLICVLTPDISLSKVYERYVNKFSRLFYQLDLVEWDSATKDEQWCTHIQEYISFYQKKLPAVLISDGYYLDEEDNHIRRSLSLIVNANFRNNSKQLYFKTIDNYLTEALEVFTDDDQCFDFILTAIENTVVAFHDVKFKVVTGKFYLPKYQMSALEQINATSNEALLWTFIDRGFQSKVVERGLDQRVYAERITREVEVIKKGGFIDYFLILADMYRFCNEQDIWYGVGRGSAAGSLVSYLCDIVSIDPIHYGLLFERFLNEGRITKTIKSQVIVINGDIEFDLSKQLSIIRNEEKITITASELRSGDRIFT